MYITISTIIVFLILLAVVDENEKAANARWEASDECKRLTFEADLARDFYKLSEEKKQQQTKEHETKKKEERKEFKAACILLILLLAIYIILFV